MRHFCSALALSTGLLASGASAATTLYTDFFAFIDEFPAVTTATFSGPLVDPFSVATTSGSIGGGTWNDLITGTDSTVWSFASPINGFGGFFDLAGPGGPGSGIKLTLGLAGGGTEVLTTEIPNSTSNTFWGFISDVAFTSVSFSLGSECCQETYTLDNLTIGAIPAPVPLPASFGLLAVAVGGMALASRKRRA